MLPAQLLLVKRRRDRIIPTYAEATSDNIDLARSMIQLCVDHIGKKKRLLNQAFTEFEDLGFDYRFVRGLKVLLERRLQLESKAVVNPINLRRKIFQFVSARGIPTSKEERSAILSDVSKELKIDNDALQESIYGDLDEEMRISGFNSPDPQNLLKQYNLSLTQTLLFGAYELSFTATGNWKNIFRQIKWFGLIYTISREGSDYWVKVNGPIALFKLTKRYGTSLAKLFPMIIESQDWNITGKIIDRSNTYRLLNLELDSPRHGQYVKQKVPINFTEVRRDAFDSKVEADFATRFKAVGTDWKIIRDPGPLPVGKFVMLPDFLLKKGQLEVYLEIVGFWTPKYLEEKVKKLNLVRDIDMIVAVDRRLACQGTFGEIKGLNVFIYKGKIPLKPIIVHLQNRIEDAIEREVQSLFEKEVSLTSPVVGAEDIAKKLGLSVEAVKKGMPQLKAVGYVKLMDIFIKETLLNEIKEALTKRLINQKLCFLEALKLIESLGGKNSTNILEALGYQIIWRGINPENAEIRKKQSST